MKMHDVYLERDAILYCLINSNGYCYQGEIVDSLRCAIGVGISMNHQLISILAAPI